MQRQLSSALNEVLPQLRLLDSRNSNNFDIVVPASTTTDNFPSSGINFNSVGQQQSTAIPHPGHSYVADRPNTIAQPNDFSLVDLGLPPAALSASSSPALPVIPKATIDKICNGEFINFDSLLPNHSPVAQDEYTFKVAGGSLPSVSLVPKHQNKPKVTSFNLWMVSWTNFFRTFIIFWPHRVSELIRYQAMICDFANQFTFAAWSGYDRMFRYRMANDQSLSWSRVDDVLYNRYLRGSSLQVLCYNCRNFGHLSSSCPLRVGSDGASQPFRAPSVQQTRLPGLCLPPPVRLEQCLGSPLPVGRVGQKPAISLTTEIARTPAISTHMSVECVWACILPSGV